MRKPDVLILHGALQTHETLEPLCEMLRGDFNCHSIELPHHGKGEQSERSFSIDAFSNVLSDYMRNRGIEQADLFGYSMGGYIGVWLAAKHPARVRKIFTLGTKFLWTEEYAQKEIRRLDPQVIEQKVPAFARELKDRHADWKKLLQQTATLMQDLGNRNLLNAEELSNVTHKVKVAWGDRDQTVSEEEQREVTKLLRNSERLILTDTGHPWEQVRLEQLAGELRDFFGS